MQILINYRSSLAWNIYTYILDPTNTNTFILFFQFFGRYFFAYFITFQLQFLLPSSTLILRGLYIIIYIYIGGWVGVHWET